VVCGVSLCCVCGLVCLVCLMCACGSQVVGEVGVRVWRFATLCTIRDID